MSIEETALLVVEIEALRAKVVELESVISALAKDRDGTYLLLKQEQSKVKLLTDALEEIANWLVCAPIASAVDMAQSFPYMYGVAEKALATVREK